MKMKKLTALVLAGVLCLGISTTVFANPSVDLGTAEENKSSVATEGVTGSAVDTSAPGNEIFKDWTNENLSADQKSERIVKSFEKELANVSDILADESAAETMSAKAYAQLQEKQAILEDLANPDILYEVAIIEDLSVEAGYDAPTEDRPITVRFDLNNKFDDIEVGQKIRILHMSDNGNVWEVYDAVVLKDKAGFYTECDFTHFSAVAVLRVTETGITPVDPSPVEPTPTQPEDNESIVVSDDVAGARVDTTLEKNKIFDGWYNDKLTPEKRSQKIAKSFENELKEVNKSLENEDYVDGLTTKQYKDLQEKQSILEMLADPDVKYELATLEELIPGEDVEVSADNPITVRFDLNGKFDDIEEGQTIRILHLSGENNSVWEIYETVVRHDYGGYYAEWDFEHFSPVAVMRVTQTGTNTDPIPEDPTQPTDPTNPEDPTNPTVPAEPSLDNNGNGTITADQLADLIVKKLQQNANTASKAIVRTSGKASPKTGE